MTKDLGNDQRYEAAWFVVIEHKVGNAYKNKNRTVMANTGRGEQHNHLASCIH